MRVSIRQLGLLIAVPVLLALAGRAAAQVVVTPAAPVVQAPFVTVYRPPVVAYYPPPAPAAVPVTTVTTYRYGLLPRNRVTVTYYGSSTVVTPAPVLRRRPVVVYP
jgi:hypothetical protein